MLDRTDKKTLALTDFKVVDLFAGAGGFSLAAKRCGGEIVFAVENDSHAANTYRQYFESSEEGKTNVLYNKDIISLDAMRLQRNHFQNPGECDLLLGGPPCQGFSSHRINDSGVNDPRNQLVYSYFEFVRALKPKVFLMENVPGMLWQRHQGFLENFYKFGKAEGYFLFNPVVIDARNYGLPQARKRVFVLGIKKSLKLENFSWPPKPTHGSPSAIAENGELLPWMNCKSVFRKAPKGDINDIHMNHGPVLKEAFRKTPKNGGSRIDSGRVLPCHQKHSGHKDVYGRIDPSKPAPTMTAGCSNPSKGRFVHPTRNHGITLRQAARIQTFPDDFNFLGGLTAGGRQIGNAVPVAMGEVLIAQIKTFLDSNKNI